MEHVIDVIPSNRHQCYFRKPLWPLLSIKCYCVKKFDEEWELSRVCRGLRVCNVEITSLGSVLLFVHVSHAALNKYGKITGKTNVGCA